MRKKTIKVTGIELRAFVRGDLSFDEMTDVNPNEADNVLITGGDGYKITLEDLTEGIRNYKMDLQYATVSPDEFCDFWVLALLDNVGDLIGLPDFLGQEGVAADDLDVGLAYLMGPFFKDEKEENLFVYSRLYDLAADVYGYENPEDLVADLQDLLDIIDNFKENKDKPRSEWKLTKWQIRQFVYKHDGDDALKNADEETIELWKKYLEELVAEEDVSAVKIKGYAYYGGDHCVCPCDWEISRDCMLKLMEIAPDDWKAMAANTLGYIYYYGRTNGGVAQYDEAYKYFSLAAFFGYYEAIYKVGDMLMAGKGTPQNKTTAFRMYKFVYDDCFPDFLIDGVGKQFADAALRMGGAYHKGNGVTMDLKRAYGHYMEARVAIDNRMKNTNFFGDTAVSAGIRSSISEIRRELGEACRQKKVYLWIGGFLTDFVFYDITKARVKINKKTRETTLTITRLKEDRWEPDPNLLLTFPDISMCKLTTTVKLSAEADVQVEIYSDKDSFLVDNIMIEDDEVHLYYKNKLMLSVAARGWYIKAEKEKGSQTMHKFVGICFENGGRVYDYLCDGMDIKVGDYVKVPSYNGMVEVQAVRVYEQSEADAPLEIVKYKKAEYAKEKDI